MALDPENKPKEFFILLLAMGLKIFRHTNPMNNKEALDVAERFITEYEVRFGSINP